MILGFNISTRPRRCDACSFLRTGEKKVHETRKEEVRAEPGASHGRASCPNGFLRLRRVVAASPDRDNSRGVVAGCSAESDGDTNGAEVWGQSADSL